MIGRLTGQSETYLDVPLLLAEGHVAVVLLLSAEESAGLAVHLDERLAARVTLTDKYLLFMMTPWSVSE